MPLASLALASIYALSSGFDPNLPLDRSFTLRNTEPFLLEREHARMADSGTAMEFIFPRPCKSLLDGSKVCEDPNRLKYLSDDGKEGMGLQVVAGEEYRSRDAGAWTSEAGIITSGQKGPVSFGLDARLFTSIAGRATAQSFDREDIDVQDANQTGSVSYSSFSRYRGNLNLQTPFGRFTAARDAAHWGPGVFYNLVFNQDAVPFNQYVFRTVLGPVSVESMFGDLLIGRTQAGSVENLNDRNLFAHRYELRLGENTVIGYSEQLILYNQNKSYLFVPIFPLFIAKGFMYEEANNGNLAFDLSRKIPGIGLVYAEALIDDMESPTSVFTKDYVQNKWGLMAGVHLVRKISGFDCGLIAEYSRLEPWVYTHFTPGTSQTANLGNPLGNQQGPNSQGMVAKVYARNPQGFYAGLKVEALWKGHDQGSSLEDPSPRNPTQNKVFLDGVSSPDFTFEPSLAYSIAYFNFSGGGSFGGAVGVWLRVQAGY